MTDIELLLVDLNPAVCEAWESAFGRHSDGTSQF